MAGQGRRMNRRERRFLAGRIVLLIIMGVTALLILTGLVFLIVLGAHSCEKDPGTSAKVRYSNYSVDAKEMGTGALIVVNKEHEYAFPSLNKDSTEGLISVTDGDIPRTENGSKVYQVNSGVYIREEAKDALDRMMQAYCKKNPDDVGSVMLVEAFRSHSSQIGKQVPAGNSDHHTGYLMNLIDSSTANGKSKELTKDQSEWINENGYKYGIVQRYPEAESHVEHTDVSNYPTAYRYVGIPHAQYMKDHNLCLEEYVEELRTKYTSRHLTVTADDVTYEIYYIPVEGEVTSGKVPANYEYTISGDNIGGVIVTVNLSKKTR